MRFAGVLRRVADRLDPPATPAAKKLVWRSREETRQIQELLLRMVDDWAYVSRVDGRHDGLLWFPSDVLSSIVYFIGHELEIRERDFESMGQDAGGGAAMTGSDRRARKMGLDV